MLANGGVFVWDPEAEGNLVIVLGYSHPFVLLPPGPEGETMRVFPVDKVRFHSLRFDQPWSLAMQIPQGHEH